MARVGDRNTQLFQVLLIDRSDRAPGDFDIEFDYQRILWETGDASTGVNGFGGSSVHAGFSNGTGVLGTFYEFEGSGVPGALLDSNPVTGLIHNSRISAVPGRYIFEVRGGLPTLLSGAPFYTENNSVTGSYGARTATVGSRTAAVTTSAQTRVLFLMAVSS